MPRRKGQHGPYGLSGNSALALRRKREADNPGMLVCRRCDKLVRSEECHHSTPTPYCVECYRSRAIRVSTGSKLAKIRLLNKSLAKSGLFHCTKCDQDKPLSLKINGSSCRACFNSYQKHLHAKKFKRIRPCVSRVGPSKAEMDSLESKLSDCVGKVFKRIAKVCPCCKTDKMGYDFYWVKRKSGRSHLSKYCRKCTSIATHRRSMSNPEKRKALRAAHRRRRQMDPEWRKRKSAKAYARFKKKIEAGDTRAIERRKAKQASARKYKDRALARERAMFPEHVVVPVDRREVFYRDGNRCSYCSCVVENTAGGWHMDHVEPLSRGGSHDYDNVVVSCVNCNQDKADQPLLLWLLNKSVA